MKKDEGEKYFFIVTPCLNAANTVDQTIESVLLQGGDFSIHYHVQDGGSTDGTVEKLMQWQCSIPEILINCKKITFTWASVSDEGMYDAVIRGFDRMAIDPDDFMTWINADDLLLPDALSSIYRISNDFSEIQWIGGPQYVIENDTPIIEKQVPTPTSVIREGLCDGHHWHFLQQEGMFFKKRLWFKAKHALSGFKLAGDWSLWREFAHHAEFFQNEKPLGAFRRRKGQLSIEKFDDYISEIDHSIPANKRTELFLYLRKMKGLSQNFAKFNHFSGKVILVEDHAGVEKEFEKRWKEFFNL